MRKSESRVEGVRMMPGEKLDERGSPRPLVAAAGLLLLGMAVGRAGVLEARWLVLGACGLWMAWLIAEWIGWRKVAGGCLAGVIFLAGAGLWMLNQAYGEQMHVARFAAGTEGGGSAEAAVSLRMRVLVPPDSAGMGGDQSEGLWLGRVQEIFTDRGWLPAAGDLLVHWRGGGRSELQRGELTEVYGWLSRPPAALNPGGIDRQQMLAADRIFAEVRVPRPGGVVVLDQENTAAEPWLPRLRLFLRAKLLENIVQQDVPAAYTITALLLGTRDPAIADISQAFADAGVAHLLAISGTHILLFAALAWGLLRLIPMRPRWREFTLTLAVIAYVLATPCGPPILRAAVALVMVLLARLAGRPREYLNTLAAAAIVIVLLRPADIASAGFQLSFIATAGLILFAPRLYHAVFVRWLEREELVAELANTSWTRRRITLYRWACGLLVGNLIGAATAAPLVALHFGQINLWSVATGIIALPFVGVAMVAGALQLIAGLFWSAAAAAISPATVAAGQAMIWVVEHLAKLPGAAVAVRAAADLAAGGNLYSSVALGSAKAVRHLSRHDRKHVRGDGRRYRRMVRMDRTREPSAPDRAGCRRQQCPSPANTRRRPVRHRRRRAARRQHPIAPYARSAPARYPPARRSSADRSGRSSRLRSRRSGRCLSPRRHRRLSGKLGKARPNPRRRGPRTSRQNGGHSRTHAASRSGNHIKITRSYNNPAFQIKIVWPFPNGALSSRRDLILLVTYAHRQILIADPAAADALALVMRAQPQLRCDAIVFLGTERGAGDEPLRQIIGPLGAPTIIWSGRGPWAEKRESPGEFNTANGAVELTIDSTGQLIIH